MEKRSKRNYLEEGVKASLQASKPEGVARAIRESVEAVDTEYPSRQTEEARIEREYELAKCGRQIINSALAERTCRYIVPRIYNQRDGEYPLPLIGDCAPPGERQLSLSLRMLKGSLQFWFGRLASWSFAEYADYDPLVEAGYDIYGEYVRAATKWQEYRTEYNLPILMAEKLSSEKYFADIRRDYLFKSATPNVDIAIRLIFSRALAHTREEQEVDKAAYINRQLGSLANIASSVRVLSRPYLSTIKSYDMPGTYSDWENDPNPEHARRFLDLANKPLNLPDSSIHPTSMNNRLRVPGHCTADMKFVLPELFEVHPEILLKQLGVEDVVENLGMTAVVLATTNAIAEETIYKNWPTLP